MARTRILAASFAASLCLAAAGLAQDPKPSPKDDDLDRLLQKIEGAKPDVPNEEKPQPKPKDEAKPDAKAKEADKDKDKPKAKAKPAEPEDKALDSLLEKLGETKEAPTTEGKAQPGDAPMPPPSDQEKKLEDAAGQKLNDKEKVTDEHLRELTGRAPKKKEQEGKGQDENSPLAQAVKKMREVEERLGQPDTGEETRKKQSEIVKDLDTLIAQAKKAGQAKGKMRPGQRMKGQGQQPGDQQGEQPGANAQGVGASKPQKPNNTPALVGDKDTWGNLPPSLREEMENVFRAEALPKREKQIGKYYESVSKKSLSSRGD